jgi:putative ABC transport system ATP-binding protein
MNKIIELNNVVKIYKRGTEKVHAVDGVSLSVDRGEFLSIVGSSGSGKTTLLNLIGCVDKPTSGSIIIDAMKVEGLKDGELTKIRATTIGFVFQQFFLLPTLTARENVELPSLFNKRTNLKNRAKELLALVGLENREDHLPSQLSGGEMQRVAIARALINDPKILLADEPTGNLDSQNAKIIIEIFKKLNQKGLTVIMVTHNIELAQQATKVIHLKDGKFLNQ